MTSVALREVVEADLPLFFEQQREPEANRMAAFPAREWEAFMAHWRKILANPTVIIRTILLDGQVAGNIVCFEEAGQPYVGYWLGKDYWGKGVATRALAVFLDQVKVRPLYAQVAKHNIASLRVLEKCGFTIYGEAKEISDTPGEAIEEYSLQLKMDWNAWEARFESFLTQETGESDVAHDLAHIRRVVANARRLASAEGADLSVVVPAAWLHDCVTVPKDSPLRSQASRLAAESAALFLQEAGYPAPVIPAIEHAIEAHSFTANLTPQTIEAQVVQDADRLDAIGAIGVARCLMLGGALGRPLYHPTEPFPLNRAPDERAYSLDHFYQKLLKLVDEMKTPTGQSEARQRTVFMQEFLAQLKQELDF